MSNWVLRCGVTGRLITSPIFSGSTLIGPEMQWRFNLLIVSHIAKDKMQETSASMSMQPFHVSYLLLGAVLSIARYSFTTNPDEERESTWILKFSTCSISHATHKDPLMSAWSVARQSDRKYAGLITSPIMSPLSVKALCLVIVVTVTVPIRDWVYNKRDAYQNSVWNIILSQGCPTYLVEKRTRVTTKRCCDNTVSICWRKKEKILLEVKEQGFYKKGWLNTKDLRST